MKKTFLLTVFYTFGLFAYAQQTDPRIAPTNFPLGLVEMVGMPSLNNAQLLEEELERRGPGIAPRFAHSFEVTIAPETHGLWENLDNGKSVWRLGVKSATAYSLNFGFSQFVMPEGGSLILYDAQQKHIMGPFTPADNEVHEQLWTPIFENEEVYIEVQVPSNKKKDLKLELSYINHDFLGFSQVASGSCNLDVICGAEDGFAIVDQYRDIIQSVAVYGFNGGTFCTGFLVNNVRNDCTPLFMTANHCDVNNGNAASLVVYWNFENSYCRQPDSPESGAGGDGVLADFNSGSIFRAAYAPSDMTLVELDDPISETANAFFAGWDTRATAPKDTIIGIHHPSTDEKRISFEFDPSYIGAWGSGSTPVPDGTHIIIPDWDIGTTEPGSSGSPIYDNQKRVVGQLHGGAAACGNNAYDSYGWMNISWEGGGTPQTRLKDWLDPDDTGALFWDGHSQMACNFFVEPTVFNQSICAPDSAIFTLQISEVFLDSVSISWSNLPEGSIAYLADSLTAPGENNVLTITNTQDIPSGIYTIDISGTDGENIATSSIVLTIANAIPAIPNLLSPAAAAMNQSLSPSFEWEAQAAGTTYGFQLATDSDFTQVVYQDDAISSNTSSVPPLDASTMYFWRVLASNTCGEASWSDTLSFTTAGVFCARTEYEGADVNIPAANASTVTSTIDIQVPGLVADISLLNLDIEHSYVGDLAVRLISPSGTIVQLFDRPGVPDSNFGCNENNLLVSFDDDATATADDFENTCEGGNVAISGAFQPIETLTALIGEPASGTWTLEVTDNADDDGGAIRDWSLDICATYPAEASLVAFTEVAEICAGDSVSFELLIGGGFDAEALNLEVSGLPVDATANFTPNDYMPASIVTMTVGNIMEDGIYDLSVEASDGVNTENVSVQLIVNGLPEIFMLQVPSNGATDVPLNSIFAWQASMNADYYQITVSTEDDLSDGIVLFEQLNTLNTTVDGLMEGTTYYWQVIAYNDCGQMGAYPIWSFSTPGDFTFATDINGIDGCPDLEVYLTITVGESYLAGAALSYTIDPPLPDLVVEYSVDPNSVNPGDEIDVMISNFDGGIYDLYFTLDDGENVVNTENVTFHIDPLPENYPDLLMPAEGETFSGDLLSLFWEEVNLADIYFVEVATDENFEDPIFQEVTNTSSIHIPLDPPLEVGFYYWRVTPGNGCGMPEGEQNVSFFEVVEPSQVFEIEGQELQISPNPTPDIVNIQLSAAIQQDLMIKVFGVNGQLLEDYNLPKGQTSLEIPLTTYPAGNYMIQINENYTAKIIKQ